MPDQRKVRTPDGTDSALPDGEENALTEDLFRQLYKYKPPEQVPVARKVVNAVACSKSTIFNLLPILNWLPQYKFKRDIVGDLVAGFTVTIMHIPHGLAYAPLAGQAPVVGLYMAIFPALIYVLLGNSRHISLGTFAVVCMMTGQVVSQHASHKHYISNGTLSNSTGGYSNLEVGVTVCFVVGVWQFVMGALRLGSLWLLLSNSLVSGFTTGAAVHVATYQFTNLLGVTGASISGPMKLVFIVIDLIVKVPTTNLVTLGISFCSVLILSVFNEVFKPIIQRKYKLRVPVPIELIVILLGIGFSYFLDLESNYGVKIVKDIPVGLPTPVLPIFMLMPSLVMSCFVIAVVSISISLSLALIFAKKHKYEIESNQELVAYGAGNMFAAFFQCTPSGASLSRSLVQSAVGGKTQLAGVVTLITMIFILLFMGPFFDPVPYSVLSSIVLVTLKGLLWQVKEFPRIWELSKLDGAVWMVTFLSVCIIDLDVGLGVGFAMSVLTLVLRGQTPLVTQLGRIPGSNLFMDTKQYRTVETYPNTLILKVTGGLHFANFSTLLDKIMKLYKDFQLSSMGIVVDEKPSLSLVLDLSCVPSLDPTSATGLIGLYKELKADHCNLILTDCNAKVYDFFLRSKFFDEFPTRNVLFSTFDAIEYLTSAKNTQL